jgi:hypothetical protein
VRSDVVSTAGITLDERRKRLTWHEHHRQPMRKIIIAIAIAITASWGFNPGTVVVHCLTRAAAWSVWLQAN